jgi:hypothetical protein
MKKMNMILKVKLRLYVLLYTVNILYYISPNMASRLYNHIHRNIYKHIVVKGA